MVQVVVIDMMTYPSRDKIDNTKDLDRIVVLVDFENQLALHGCKLYKLYNLCLLLDYKLNLL